MPAPRMCLLAAVLLAVPSALPAQTVPAGTVDTDLPLHWLAGDGWLYVGVRGVDSLARRTWRMPLFDAGKDARPIFQAAAAQGRLWLGQALADLQPTDAELDVLTADVREVHGVVRGWATPRAALAIRYGAAAAAERVFADRAAVEGGVVQLVGRFEAGTLYRVPESGKPGLCVAFMTGWMLCTPDRARLEAILSGAAPEGGSLAGHPLLSAGHAATRPAGRPLLPADADFNVLYDAQAHLATLRADLEAGRAAAAPDEVAQWDERIARLAEQIKGLRLADLRGVVLMSRLSADGDGGTVADVFLTADSPWLGLGRQAEGVGRLLHLLPSAATVGAVGNLSRPLAMLDALAPAAGLLAGAAGEGAVAMLLARAGPQVRKLALGYVADAAVVLLGGDGQDARPDLVLCMGLNDPKAAEPVVAAVVEALAARGPQDTADRVVRKASDGGLAYWILAEAGAEGQDAALAAWAMVGDTLLFGSPAGVRQVAAGFRDRRTMMDHYRIVGELARTPGTTTGLLVCRPDPLAALLGTPDALNVFAADFPLILKIAPAEGGLRLRANVSIPALAATWGVAALAAPPEAPD